MKLPRRRFLHLAAGAAALPACRVDAWARSIRRGRCDGSCRIRRVAQQIF